MRVTLIPSTQEIDALSEFARIERRQPRDAARFLIAKGWPAADLISVPRIDPVAEALPEPVCVWRRPTRGGNRWSRLTPSVSPTRPHRGAHGCGRGSCYFDHAQSFSRMWPRMANPRTRNRIKSERTPETAVVDDFVWSRSRRPRSINLDLTQPTEKRAPPPRGS